MPTFSDMEPVARSGELILTEPVPYKEMIVLESNAKVVITDSGGIQKESYFFRAPAVIPRDETEWIEIVDAGWNVLAGADKNRIIDAARMFYEEGCNRNWNGFYGNGNAVGKIVDIIKQ